MGRYNFGAQRMHAHVTRLLELKRITYPPPWYQVLHQYPPPAKLVRPVLQRPQRAGKKSSRLFKPVSISYEEDNLRWEYFNDHPWELARPRVVLEDDGRDREKWDWSVELDVSLNPPPRAAGMSNETFAQWARVVKEQSSRPLNGEAVVKRQRYLLRHTPLSEAAAYDCARKELYRVRHAREIQARVAHEEALATGAYFGPGPLEIGMRLEDKSYETWRSWAEKQALEQQNARASRYSGADVDDEEDIEQNEALRLKAEESILGEIDGEGRPGGV